MQDVSLDLRKGETLGLVGESGSGKSTLGLAIMGLIQFPGRITAGRIFFEGRDITKISREESRRIRGRRIAMIFQDPMTSLNPVMKIRDHFMEYVRTHDRQVSQDQARAKTASILQDLGIPSSRMGDYPHQFSGGMRQRVMIGLALMLEPSLIIADEPTTALDVIVEAQILQLVRDLRRKYSLSLILITDNMGIVAEVADRVAVMYAGKIAEVAPTVSIFDSPKHPYTQGLLESIPTVSAQQKVLRMIPGSPPDLTQLPTGCPFHPRCPFAFQRCTTEEPMLRKTGDEALAACHLLP